MTELLSLFATAARGTEDLLAEELRELGARRIRQDRGGVRFLAPLEEALRVCLWTRIAMRVLYPLGEYEAQGAEGLYEASAQVPWEEYLTPASSFAVEATLRDSEHSHSGFVALKVKDALVDRLRQKLGARPDVDTRNPQVRVVAHLARERLSLSLDLAGEPLHRRGYRVRTTPAPLKETLAAALVRAAGYTGEEALVDPMCGSGTLLIEAGLVACRRAPGVARTFGVERWPHLGKQATKVLEALMADARRQERPAPFPLVGYDKSADAVEAARRNFRAAGLEKWLRVSEGDATKPPKLPEGGGLILTNPPYGDRLGAGGQKGMKAFYYRLGESLWVPGWRLWVLAGNPGFESAFHRRPQKKRAMWNGPIACTLLGYGTVGAGDATPGRKGSSEAPLGAPQEPEDVVPVREEDEGQEEG